MSMCNQHGDCMVQAIQQAPSTYTCAQSDKIIAHTRLPPPVTKQILLRRRTC